MTHGCVYELERGGGRDRHAKIQISNTRGLQYYYYVWKHDIIVLMQTLARYEARFDGKLVLK
jgi:hypothetical protein